MRNIIDRLLRFAAAITPQGTNAQGQAQAKATCTSALTVDDFSKYSSNTNSLGQWTSGKQNSFIHAMFVVANLSQMIPLWHQSRPAMECYRSSQNQLATLTSTRLSHARLHPQVATTPSNSLSRALPAALPLSRSKPRLLAEHLDTSLSTLPLLA